MCCQRFTLVLIFGQCTPERKERKMFRVITIALALLTLTTIVTASQYVAPDHYKFHDWYKQIQAELKISNCCDELNNDCGPSGDNYVDLGYNGTKVLLEDGKWYIVRSTKKYYVNTPDGGAHVCRKPHTSGQGYNFYCIFLPQLIGRNEHEGSPRDARA